MIINLKMMLEQKKLDKKSGKDTQMTLSLQSKDQLKEMVRLLKKVPFLWLGEPSNIKNVSIVGY